MSILEKSPKATKEENNKQILKVENLASNNPYVQEVFFGSGSLESKKEALEKLEDYVFCYKDLYTKRDIHGQRSQFVPHSTVHESYEFDQAVVDTTSLPDQEIVAFDGPIQDKIPSLAKSLFAYDRGNVIHKFQDQKFYPINPPKTYKISDMIDGVHSPEIYSVPPLTPEQLENESKYNRAISPTRMLFLIPKKDVPEELLYEYEIGALDRSYYEDSQGPKNERNYFAKMINKGEKAYLPYHESLVKEVQKEALMEEEEEIQSTRSI